MNLRKGSIAALLAAAGMALSAGALAQGMRGPDAGWYVGGTFGQSTADGACDDFAGTGLSCDDKDTAWKIFGGYQVNRNFAAEFGYTNLGEISVSGFGFNASAEATAWELVGVGSFPVANRLSLFGKIGFYRAEAEYEDNTGVTADESNTGLTFGFGARYDITRNLGLRLEWQRYSDVGGDDTGESDVDVLGVSVIWKF